MTIEEIEAELSRLDAEKQALHAQALVLSVERDKKIAEAKIAAMPEAEREALIALMKGA